MGFFDRLFGGRKRDEPADPNPGVASETTQDAVPEPAPATHPAAESAPEPDGLDPEELAHTTDWLREQSHVNFMINSRDSNNRQSYAMIESGLVQIGEEEGLSTEQALHIIRGAYDLRKRWATRYADADMSGQLRQAFFRIEEYGFLAREHFGISTGDGHSYMRNIARGMNPVPAGYVFFHAQDTESLVDGPATLHLRYGKIAYDSTDAAGKTAEDEAVGRKLMDFLRDAGFDPDWNGKGTGAIAIHDMAWYAMPVER
ncbi:MAG: DUF6891 domain-containing protein [Gulosibacter sp.]|uniref:DUF6891 domain-containing protein n=1 Tax=Gulosibacter sp. TaxID=2817531 RepID=UPI003F93D8D3